jgi:hypothetical protein
MDNRKRIGERINDKRMKFFSGNAFVLTRKNLDLRVGMIVVP